MKHLKMLGLAAVASAALMALVGASSASAAVLCKTETDPCNSLVKKTETVSAQLMANKEALINISSKFAPVECKQSTIAGKVAKEGGKGNVPEVTVETLSFTQCSCEVLVMKDGTYYVSHIVGTPNGTPFGTGQELTFQCNTILFGKVKCMYLTNNTPLGELQGANPAILAVNAELPLVAGSSGLCRAEGGIWTGKYEVTTPKPLYVETE